MHVYNKLSHNARNATLPDSTYDLTKALVHNERERERESSLIQSVSQSLQLITTISQLIHQINQPFNQAINQYVVSYIRSCRSRSTMACVQSILYLLLIWTSPPPSVPPYNTYMEFLRNEGGSFHSSLRIKIVIKTWQGPKWHVYD